LPLFNSKAKELFLGRKIPEGGVYSPPLLPPLPSSTYSTDVKRSQSVPLIKKFCRYKFQDFSPKRNVSQFNLKAWNLSKHYNT
jgi:hypothetical protein